MIGDVAQDIALVAKACPGMSVDEILSLPVAQRMQLRSAGLIVSDVKLKPAGGTKERRQALAAIGKN